MMVHIMSRRTATGLALFLLASWLLWPLGPVDLLLMTAAVFFEVWLRSRSRRVPLKPFNPFDDWIGGAIEFTETCGDSRTTLFAGARGFVHSVDGGCVRVAVQVSPKVFMKVWVDKYELLRKIAPCDRDRADEHPE